MFGQYTVQFGFTWTYVSYGKTTIRCRSRRCYTIFFVDIMYPNTALTSFCQMSNDTILSLSLDHESQGNTKYEKLLLLSLYKYHENTKEETMHLLSNSI